MYIYIEWHRVLRQGGILMLGVPDLMTLCRMYIDPKLTMYTIIYMCESHTIYSICSDIPEVKQMIRFYHIYCCYIFTRPHTPHTLLSNRNQIYY